MYDIVYIDELWWITYNGEIIREIGGFIEPVSPKMIIREIENNEV